MPYGAKFLPPILALLYTLSIIVFIIPFLKSSEFKFNKVILLLPIFAIIGSISLFYTKNTIAGLKILERHISFIILPFLFLLNFKRLLTLKSILFFLSISLLISFAISIFLYQTKFSFIITFNQTKNIDHFIRLIRYRGFPIEHPSYYSYLILIYIIIVFNYRIKEVLFKILIITCTIMSFIFLFLLGSRAAMISIFALLLYFIIKQFFLKRYVLFAITISFLILSFYSVINFTRFGNTVIKINKKNKNVSQVDSRLIIWENAINLIKQNPILGYGIGDALDEMIKEHKKTGFTKGVERRLDAHNQFLESWLQSGILGLISLILVFVIPFYQAIIKRQEMLFLFLLVSFIQILFESMFIRLAGVVYFSFFYSYLYYFYYYPKNRPITTKILSV